MISLDDTYPNKTIPANSDYPGGSIKNETVPNVSDDGTPLDRAHGNDNEGFKQAIARACGIVPTVPGNIPDTAVDSQLFRGLVELIQGRATNYNETGVTNALVLVPQANQQAPDKLFDNQEFYFTASLTTTGSATINLVGLGGGVKNIRESASLTILSGERYLAMYDLPSDDVIIKELSAGIPFPGYTSATRSYTVSDEPFIETDRMDVLTLLPVSTLSQVGQTGSAGGGNEFEWPKLDSLPQNTKYIDVRVTASGVNSSSSSSASVYLTTTEGVDINQLRPLIITPLQINGADTRYSDVRIAVTPTDKTFKLYYYGLGSGVTITSIKMYLTGFGV